MIFQSYNLNVHFRNNPLKRLYLSRIFSFEHRETCKPHYSWKSKLVVPTHIYSSADHKDNSHRNNRDGHSGHSNGLVISNVLNLLVRYKYITFLIKRLLKTIDGDHLFDFSFKIC